MGTDHTAIPKDLRPLNIAPEGFFPNPPHEPTATTLSPRSGTGIGTAYLPSMASDSGLGFPNPGTAWNPSKPVSTTAVSAGFGGLGFREGTNSTNLEVSGRVGGNASGEIVGDCSGSTGATSNSRKVKFLCSFGGKILPRPSDSVLRYVGGHTRIISVRRDVRFEEFVQKMFETCGQPVVIKYQLPDEDLDALVSVSCAEDLENMMEEYGKLVERSADGSAKLRVFLFSPLEVEESVLVHFSDLQDSGQRFVEAVNGIPDVVVGSSRLTRRGSIVSATSTQNSDGVMSAGDVLDSHGTTGVGEVGGLISPGTTSPRVAAAAATAAPDVAARLTYIVPNSELQKPQAPPAVGRPQQPVAVDLQRTYGMEFPPGSPYVPSMDFPSSGASKDHRQDTFNIVDSTLFPSNTGFSSTQAIGLDGSLYRQIDHSQQFRDSFTALPPNHVIPVMQMTVPSSAAPVSARPNAVPQSPQHHQSQLNVYGYQPQSPPFLVPVTLQGGVVEWRQVPPPDHVVLSDGLTSYQQRPPLPESVPSFEDCYMCQKALPHAHSDTLIHEQRHNSPNASNPAFHSLRAEDNLWIQHPNRLPVSETSSESIAEHQGVKTQPRVAGQINHDTFTPQFGVHSLASNPDLLHDHESILLQRRGISDSSKMFNPATGGSSSDAHVHYGVHMDNATQFFQGLLPQQNVPLQDQVNHTAYLVSQPIGSDAGPIKPMNIKPPGQVAQESAMGYISKNPGIVTKDEIVGSRVTSDLRPIDGRMEALHISPPEVSGMIEQNVLPIGREQKHEEFSDVKQQMTGNAIYQNNGVTRPGIVPEQLRLVEMQSIPMAEGVQLNFRQPTETNQVTVSESYNVSGPHPMVTAAIPLMTTEEIWQGRPSFANAGSVHTNTGGLSPGDDWKYEASHVNSRMDANITVAGASSDTFSSSSPSYVGDAQNAISANSLFSHQDPWSLRHDPHFPPPRPTKVPASKEAFVVKEETVIPQPSGHLHDLGSENTRSVKDEHIKQELQAVAEGVAASVLQSSTTSDHNACGTIGPTSEVYQPREDNDGDEEARCRNQLEDGKSELLEKMAPAFPFAENIGRLQIIKNSDLEELRELGSGTFGTVYHGKWRGSDVAIKRINDRCFSGKPSEQDRMRHDFWNEAIKLADLHHPNVVAFYGVVLDGPGGSVATVTEYMVNGSLRQALIRNDRTLDKRKRLLIAMDVAFGMEYLHGKNIVHFDLKSDNLLVNLRDPHRPICKVGDLGLSKLKCQTLISGGVRGTLPWMAPELLNGSSNLVSEKVDVFSFGIVMWELLTGEEPYADLHYGAIIGGIVNNTLRPPVSESCDPEWRALMEKCWAAEPSERPSFTEIANQLRSMAASLPPKGQAQHTNSSQPQAQK